MSVGKRFGYYRTVMKEKVVLGVIFVASRWPDGSSPCSREKEVK